MRRLTLFLVCLLAGWLAATPAFGHASLLATDPAEGAVLDIAPAAITLTFNETVAATAVRLLTPAGTIIDLTAQADGTHLRLPLPTLASGTHLLSWRVVSDDGHPISGALAFSVNVPSAEPPVLPAADTGLRPWIWGARFALYLGLFVGAAGAFFVVWVAAPGAVSRVLTRTLIGFSLLGLAAAVPGIALQGLDLLGETASAAFRADTWRTAFASTYPRTVVGAVVALLAALAALLISHTGLRRGFALIAWLGIGVAFALAGHASNAPPPAFSRTMVALHTIAVAFWIGALLPLAFLLRDPTSAARESLARFSASIPSALGLLAVSGAVLALLQLERVADLVSTAYGRVLGVKLLLVAALLLLAAVNRFVLTPRMDREPKPAAAALRRSTVLEWLLVVAVFAVVSLWRFTPPPRAASAVAPVPVEASASGGSAPPVSSPIVSSTPPVAETPPAARPEARRYFMHFHMENFAADITMTATGGQLAASVVFYTAEMDATLPAMEVTVALAMPQLGLEAQRRAAQLQPDGSWLATGFTLPVADYWAVDLDVLVSDFDRRSMRGGLMDSRFPMEP